MHKLRIKRIYAAVDPNDGYRILIDRLWPRGMSKDEASLDNWAKSIAPSTEIRKAFNHEPANMAVFRKNYVRELDQNPASSDFAKLITDQLRLNNVTFVYGAKNEKYNQAVVLKDWIEAKLRS
jgi:uncharacterized protein YeaO (DUF488 family)